MLNKEQIQTLLEGYLKDTDYALITLEISPMNEILVEIDRLAGVDVEDCGKLNGWLVEQLDKMGEEDYALEVGSVSLSDPFKTKMQYEKHLGDDVEVLTTEGKKLRGQLVSVDEETFSIDVDTMVVVEGKKRKQHEIVTHTWKYGEVKYTKYMF